MSEREVVLDEPIMDEQAVALQHAVERADRAEAELAKLKRAAAAHAPADHAAANHAQGNHAPGNHAPVQPMATSNEHGREREASDTHSAEEQGHALHNPALTGMDALREDPMMRHLLDSLAAGSDIGHYGRLTFTMIARHFLGGDELIGELTRDQDFSEEQARLLVHQVDGRDYSPPRRERIAEWQAQQEFAIIPTPEDPDCGNVYRSLKFPSKTYHHIEHYQEEKTYSGQ